MNSRRKGAEGERELPRTLREYGYGSRHELPVKSRKCLKMHKSAHKKRGEMSQKVTQKKGMQILHKKSHKKR